jgi:hypothetical protein
MVHYINRLHNYLLNLLTNQMIMITTMTISIIAVQNPAWKISPINSHDVSVIANTKNPIHK